MADVAKFYHTVIDDVITGMKESFIEDGLDTELLLELKKLWVSKLTETHAFDPEPPVQTSAQYAQRFQLSHNPQLLLNRVPIQQNQNVGGNPPRALVPIIRSNPPLSLQPQQMPSQQPGVLSGLNASNITLLRPAVGNLQSSRPIVLATALNPQHAAMVQQRPTNPLSITLRGPLPNSALGQQQQQQTMLAPATTNLNGMTAANIAGQNGHFFQIGQQTYWVPQAPIQPRPPQAIFAQPQPPRPQQQQDLQGSVFNRTQVDGGGDGSDEDQYDAFSEAPSSINPPASVCVQFGGVMTPSISTGPHHDLSSDEDDDDLVPATPGLTPPASALSATGLTPRIRDTHSGTNRHTSFFTPLRSVNASETPTCDTAESTPTRQPTSIKRGHSPTGSRNKSEPAAKRGAFDTSDDRNYPLSYGADDSDDYEADDYDDNELDSTIGNTPAGHRGDTTEESFADEGELDTAERNFIRKSRNRVTKQSSSRVGKRISTKAEEISHEEFDEDVTDDDNANGKYSENNYSNDSSVVKDTEEEEEEPLNSEDDVSEEEPELLFQSENLVICQYDKIHRTRNKWKFHLRDGIMMIRGRDHIFQKATGEAEW